MRREVPHDDVIGGRIYLQWEFPLQGLGAAPWVIESCLAPGSQPVSLASMAQQVASERHHDVNHEPYAWWLERFQELMRRDVVPWLLGERDPVKERLRSRGQHEAST